MRCAGSSFRWLQRWRPRTGPSAAGRWQSSPRSAIPTTCFSALVLSNTSPTGRGHDANCSIAHGFSRHRPASEWLAGCPYRKSCSSVGGPTGSSPALFVAAWPSNAAPPGWTACWPVLSASAAVIPSTHPPPVKPSESLRPVFSLSKPGRSSCCRSALNLGDVVCKSEFVSLYFC